MVDLYIIVIIIGIAIIIGLYLLPRYGPHYRSRLTCPDCKKQFTYHWIPGGSFLSMRSGKLRRLKCPYCQKRSLYNIVAYRIKKNKPAKTTNSKHK